MLSAVVFNASPPSSTSMSPPPPTCPWKRAVFVTRSTSPVAPRWMKMLVRLRKPPSTEANRSLTPPTLRGCAIRSGSNAAPGCHLTPLTDGCDSQTAINDEKSLSTPARNCPEGRRWDAFLTAHVLHLERIDGSGAETLVECRSRALSNVYFSIIKLSFHCFLLDDVISAATSSFYWQTETQKRLSTWISPQCFEQFGQK